MKNHRSYDALKPLARAPASRATPGLAHTIASDRREITALAAYAVEYGVGSGPSLRRALYPTLRKELLAHSAALRAVLLSEWLPRRSVRLRRLAEQLFDEHCRIERRLERLDRIDIASTTWLRELDELRRAWIRLAHTEETHLAPALRRRFEEPLCRQLEHRYLEDKRQRLESLAAPPRTQELAAGA